LLEPCSGSCPWYAIWPLSLATLLPSLCSIRLAHIFGFSTLLKPLLAAPLLLWGSAPPANCQQLALTVTLSAGPWLYVLFARPRWRAGLVTRAPAE
jgi:hypothetical protein